MKKKRKVIGILTTSLIIGLIGCLLILGQSKTSLEKLEAKPGSEGVDPPIVIDENESYSYSVPFDSTNKIESLPATFDNYVQNTKRLLYASKLNINGYSTAFNDSGTEIFNLPNNRYIAFYGSRDRGVVGASYIAILNLNGDVLKKYATNNATLTTELVRPVLTNKNYQQYSFDTIQLSDTMFMQGYGFAIKTVAPNYEYGAHFIEVANDNTVRINNRELTSLGLTGKDYEMKSVLGDIYSNNRFTSGSSILNPTNITDPSNLGQTVTKTTRNITQPTLAQLGLGGRGWDAWQTSTSYQPVILQEFDDGSLLVKSLYVNTNTIQPHIVSTYLLDSAGIFKPNSAIYTWANGNGEGSITPLKLISDKSKTSVISINRPTNSQNENTLIYEYKSGQVGAPTVVKEYPYNTSMIISQFIDASVPSVKYVAAGNVSTISSEFRQKGMTVPGAFVAFMDDDLNIESIGSISDPNDGTLLFNDMAIKGGKVGVSGTSFFNSSFVSNVNAVAPQGKYATKDPLHFTSDAFFGGLDTYYDYSPLIKAPGYIMVDIDDPGISSGNNAVTSNWLITGERNGNFTLNTAIKVHDSFDLDFDLGNKTQGWLNKRINVNPLDINYPTNTDPTTPIDWKALGFDKEKRGPQLVTYFITDTKSQATSTSRNVNKIDEHTEVDPDAAIGADNVVIHINDAPDFWYDQTKPRNWKPFGAAEMSEMTAWLLTGLDESLTTKIEIDQTELAAINNTDIAKPFPLTYTYKYANGKEVVKKITVFVIDDKTGVENKMVLYGQDYRLKIPSESTAEDKGRVINHSDVVVYNQKKNSQNTGVPELIADKNSPLIDYTVNAGNLLAINNGEYPQVLPQGITYTNSAGKSVTGRVDVTLYLDIVLNIRQVVLEPNDGLVVPIEGFTTITYDYTAENLLTEYKNINANVISTEDIPTQTYTTVKLEGFEGFNYNSGSLIVDYKIPEYYQYDGYISTANLVSHNSQSSQFISETVTKEIKIDFTEKVNEFWVSIYIKPTKNMKEELRPYSWSYQVNEYDEIINN
ncbi:hypothetical protein I6N95_03820 [Vagococcus sp. BWB3-3]|uniref:Uncharacterized protein n=1 Tax=Vagococcus allomyrinae TaxID=2794353 RepID=A0A940PCC5_9ENTE|nr:hypothetical protein [Vagococcus allomyrinae]MBP1040133.1 hypothetical protein [Vagococcus allomyrinae]